MLYATGTLSIGLATRSDTSSTTHKDYKIRPPKAADYFAAEQVLAERLSAKRISPHATPMFMEAAVTAQCLEQLGTLQVITLDMLGKLTPDDLNTLTTETKLLERRLTLATLEQEASSPVPVDEQADTPAIKNK